MAKTKVTAKLICVFVFAYAKSRFSHDAAQYTETQVFEPCHNKTCLWGFQPGPTQTGLYSHRRWLEACNFGFRNIFVAKTKALISCGVTAQLDSEPLFSHMQKADVLMTRLFLWCFKQNAVQSHQTFHISARLDLKT